MSLLKWMVIRIKLVFLCIINAIRRSFCCFRRKKPPCDSIVLTDVITTSSIARNKEDDVNWNVNWDMDGNKIPNSIQDHIEIYREKKSKKVLNQNENEESDLNFFQDMTPKIIPQKKVVLKTNNSSNDISSRLKWSDQSYVPMIQPELTEWEDSDVMNSWEETEDCDTGQAIREKRKADREKRLAEQLRKKQEKEMIKMLSRQSLATKIS